MVELQPTGPPSLASTRLERVRRRLEAKYEKAPLATSISMSLLVSIADSDRVITRFEFTEGSSDGGAGLLRSNITLGTKYRCGGLERPISRRSCWR